MAAKYDVVIVGAGISGLLAAYRLQQQGKNVVVIEGADRVGGRTNSKNEVHDGKPNYFDLGAHFVSQKQQNVKALIQELNVPYFVSYDTGNSLSDMLGKVTQYKNLHIPISGELLLFLVEIEATLEIDVTQPWHQWFHKHDNMSMWDWLNANDKITTHANKELFFAEFRIMANLVFSAEPEDISFLWFLFYIKANYGIQELISYTGAWRLDNGAQSISEALYAKLGDKIVRLNNKVANIVQTDNEVTVITTDLNRFTGTYAIVAMSPYMSAKINYEPALTPERTAAANSMPLGYSIMSYSLFKSPFWRNAGLTGESLSDHGIFTWTKDNTSSNGYASLLAFMVANRGADAGKLTQEQRQTQVLAQMTHLYGSEINSQFIKYNDWDVNKDPWVAAAPSFMKPRTVIPNSKYILQTDHNSTPHKRVYWASTEAAQQGNGYMDGAVWSGNHVAGILAKLLH